MSKNISDSSFSTSYKSEENLYTKEEFSEAYNDVKELCEKIPSLDFSIIEKSCSSTQGLKIEDQYKQIALACQAKGFVHPNWILLAGQVKMKYIKKTVPKTFSESTRALKDILNKDYFNFVMDNAEILNEMIDEEKDYKFDYLAVENLIKSYFARIKKDGKTTIYETPQYMYMRISTYLWFDPENLKESLVKIKNMYRDLSEGVYSMASPTMFNAGLKRSQLASCFTFDVGDDIQSLAKSWKDSAIISMNSGGIGFDATSIRHSEIGQYGQSNGVVPWLKVMNQILNTVNQCFHSDTIVYTINDGPKPISLVVPGDKLVRSDGGKGRVLKPIVHDLKRDLNSSPSYNKQEFYRLDIESYTKGVIVSDTHPFLAIRCPESFSSQDIIERLETGRIVPEYIESKFLNEDYLVSFPIPRYEKDLPYYNLDDCQMYGIIMGNKSFVQGKIQIELDKESQYQTYEFIKNYLIGHDISYSVFPTNRQKIIVSWNWCPQFPFTEGMTFSRNAKYFHPSLLHLPMEKLKSIFQGIVESGNLAKSCGQYIELFSNSEQFSESVRYLLLRLGILASKDKTNTLFIEKTPKIQSILGEENNLSYQNYFEFGERLWSRVSKKEIVPEVEVGILNHVYDLQMEPIPGKDEDVYANYLTSVGIVHNGGRRAGSGTVYLCCWHLDVEEFLDLRKPSGPEDMRARDLFYALWISDEFMRRVEKDQDWTLFCPNKVPKLDTKWGLDFEIAYRAFEKKARDGKVSHYRVIKARDLWKKIILTQIETGMPFMLYKDSINRKSNQRNLGTIRESNLCCEITLYTDKENIGSCNLGSIALNSCVNTLENEYDFKKLEDLTRKMVQNINQMIDRNYYPPEIPEIKYTNLRNRPLGIGVQGLSDTFAMLDLPWISPEAKKLNEMIFETMYYAAVSESVNMAREYGKYETFSGSPASKGLFQFDLWDLEKVEKEFEGKSHEEPFVSVDFLNKHVSKRRGATTDRYDWESLRGDMMKYGLRNSLLMALMPTATSASILDNNEAFEPHTQHIFARTVLSGQHIVINKHLVKDLERIDMWNTETVRNILKNSGVITHISEEGLSEERLSRLKFLKKKHLTVFEIPQKVLVDMCADRGRYVCQTQSFNCWMPDPTFSKLNAFHFYGWKNGCKTGMYYLRQTAKTDPINFSLDSINIPTKKQLKSRGKWKCSEDVCTACSS